jgi:hypothetical protein
MLDTFCNSVSDQAQLKIAVRLGKIALPVWSRYLSENPTAIEKINELAENAIHLKRAQKVDIGFPQRALEKIERSYMAAKENAGGKPIPLMKCDATLSPMLATCMQPLTNPQWDNVLPQSVKLVFTLVFNILVWILYRRRNAEHETHIYVAINQGADVLLRESLRSADDINNILAEYKLEIRGDTEDTNWENAFPVGESEPLDQEDIYRKIIGEKVFKDSVTTVLAKEVLRQMREEGKSYWNELDEYNTGTSTTYSYNKEEKSFWRSEFDVIVGSFHNQIPMSENEMLGFVSQQSLGDLRGSGFEV